MKSEDPAVDPHTSGSLLNVTQIRFQPLISTIATASFTSSSSENSRRADSPTFYGTAPTEIGIGARTLSIRCRCGVEFR